MQTKIMSYTFVVSLVLVALVAHNWPSLWNALHPGWLTFDIEILGLKNIPASYVVVAGLFALVMRITAAHNRISTIFGIRERFDLFEILLPLAAGAGVLINLTKREELRQKRHEIMAKVFYKYVSSTKPEIDQHFIWTALDRWSWFWILIEATALCLIALAVLLSIGSYKAAAWLATFAIIQILVATQVNRACSSIAQTEVRIILEDPQKALDVQAAFHAL